MKNKFSLIISGIAIIAVMIISSCGNSAEQKQQEVTNALQDIENELKSLETEITEEVADSTVTIEAVDSTEVVETTEE